MNAYPLTRGRNFQTATTSRTCRSEAAGRERRRQKTPSATWTPPASLSTLLLFGLHRNGANKPFFLLESLTPAQSTFPSLLLSLKKTDLFSSPPLTYGYLS